MLCASEGSLFSAFNARFGTAFAYRQVNIEAGDFHDKGLVVTCCPLVEGIHCVM